MMPLDKLSDVAPLSFYSQVILYLFLAYTCSSLVIPHTDWYIYFLDQKKRTLWQWPRRKFISWNWNWYIFFHLAEFRVHSYFIFICKASENKICIHQGNSLWFVMWFCVFKSEALLVSYPSLTTHVNQRRRFALETKAATFCFPQKDSHFKENLRRLREGLFTPTES